MTIPSGDEGPTELYPLVAAVASQYGDPNGTYVGFLSKAESSTYVSDASFFWDQPLSDHGFAASLTSSSAVPTPTGSSSSKSSHNAAKGKHGTHAWAMLYGACTVVMAVSFIDFL